MSEGLITRIGKWIDSKWEEKASERDMIERTQALERMVKSIRNDLEERFGVIATDHFQKIEHLEVKVKLIQDAQQPFMDPTKDIGDLKTRLEKIELYAGMTRKIDPTKPPVAKSAFSM